MIISDSQKLAFCHIPKNGGTSLRHHLLQSWPDARAYGGLEAIAAADGPVRDLQHLTVGEARAYFGEDLVQDGYRILAVVREPGARARSALHQYLRTHFAERRDYLRHVDVAAFLRAVSVPDLCKRSRTDHGCVHFRPQVDFIEGVPEESLDLLALDRLAQRFPNLAEENSSGSLPVWLRPMDNRITRGALRTLGRGVRQRIRRALTRQDNDLQQAIASAVLAEKEFLDDFYSADRVLHDKVVNA